MAEEERDGANESDKETVSPPSDIRALFQTKRSSPSQGCKRGGGGGGGSPQKKQPLLFPLPPKGGNGGGGTEGKSEIYKKLFIRILL